MLAPVCPIMPCIADVTRQDLPPARLVLFYSEGHLVHRKGRSHGLEAQLPEYGGPMRKKNVLRKVKVEQAAKVVVAGGPTPLVFLPASSDADFAMVGVALAGQ